MVGARVLFYPTAPLEGGRDGSRDTAARLGAEPAGKAREETLRLVGKGRLVNLAREIQTFFHRDAEMRHLGSTSLVHGKK